MLKSSHIQSLTSVCKTKNPHDVSSKSIFHGGDRELRAVGPACFHRLGAQEHSLVRWRPWKHHHLWRVCRWCKCQLPGEEKKDKTISASIFYSAEIGYVIRHPGYLARLADFNNTTPASYISRGRKNTLALTAFCSANVLVAQILSPYNKGLVKRAISQSGAALCPWAHNKQPLKTAKEVWDCQIWPLFKWLS